MRRPRRIIPARHPNADRYLSGEEKLAHVICSAVHSAGCTCDGRAAATCSTMIWAAKRVLKHLGKPEA